MQQEENLSPPTEVADADKLLIVEEFKKLKGVGEARALKFIDAGYMSIAQIAVADVRDFVDRTGLPKTSAEQLITNARGLVDLGKVESLIEVKERQDASGRLTTGSSMVDELLCGGFPTQLVTEIASRNGNGKSQWCMTEAVLATQPEKDGGLGEDGCTVIYLDTENTFSAKRVIQIATERGLDVDKILRENRILRVLATSSAHQKLLIDTINKITAECKNDPARAPVRLLIVDSIIAHYRSEYVGRGALAERQQALGDFLSDLQTFAIANDAVVLVTNQMEAVPDGFGFGPQEQPCGGNVLGHACAYRMQIRKGQQGTRIVRLSKAPDLPPGEAPMTVTDWGVTDVGSKKKK